jgi:hypothetical protein
MGLKRRLQRHSAAQAEATARADELEGPYKGFQERLRAFCRSEFEQLSTSIGDDEASGAVIFGLAWELGGIVAAAGLDLESVLKTSRGSHRAHETSMPEAGEA